MASVRNARTARSAAACSPHSYSARSPYLLGIAAFVLLMTWVSTFLYLEQQAFRRQGVRQR